MLLEQEIARLMRTLLQNEAKMSYRVMIAIKSKFSGKIQLKVKIQTPNTIIQNTNTRGQGKHMNTRESGTEGKERLV